MLIVYRRTGLVGLLVLGSLALVAAVVTAVVAATALVIALAGAATVLFARAVLPRSWRRRPITPAAPSSGQTIEGTVVNAIEEGMTRK